jgi:hypothetical protein
MVQLARKLSKDLSKHLARALNDDDAKLYGVAGISAANRMETAGTGGESGSATGFGLLTFYRLDAIAAASQYLVSRQNSLAGSVGQGYQQYVTSAGVVVTLLGAGGASWVQPPTRTLVASDVGRVHASLVYCDGAKGRMWTDRMQAADGTSMGTYQPFAGPMHLGTHMGALPATGITFLGVLAFQGTPTNAQLEALYDQARILGDVPRTMDGATVTHRWSARDQLRGVVNPAGRVTYGARGFSAANYLSTANGSAGSGSGLVVGVHVRFESIPGSTNGRIISKGNTFNNGWSVQCVSGALRLNAFGSAGAADEKNSPNLTVSSTDVGQSYFALFQHDGTALRSYRRVETGTGTTITGLAVPSAAMYIGRDNGGATDASAVSVFGIATKNGTLSAAQVTAWFDACEAAGKLVAFAGAEHLYELSADATVADRIGTDPLTRTGTLELAKYVETAPPAPLSLADTITAASADALARVGSPTVKVIDPSVEGRKTYGVAGFSAANYLATLANKGIKGSSTTGGFVASLVRINSVAVSSTGIITERRDASPIRGMILAWSGTPSIDWNVYDTNSAVYTRTYTPVAGDVGQMLLIVGNLTAAPGVSQLFVRRTQVGADLAVPSYTVPSSASRTMIGLRDGGTLPLTACDWFGTTTGDVGLTLAEITQLFDDVERTGRIQPVPGKSTWTEDPTADIEAAGGPSAGVPAVVLDRIGTDHLSRVGVDVQTTANSIRAIGPFSSADAFVSAVGGGIQGSNAMHVVMDVWITKVPTGNEELINTAGGAAVSGYRITILSTGVLRCTISNVANSTGYTLTGADVGKRLRVVLNKTTTKLQFWVNGTQMLPEVDAASYTAPSGLPMEIGRLSTGFPALSTYVELVQGSSSASLTSGEIAALNADLTAPPPLTAGKTAKRWRLEQDIAEAGGKLPTLSTERISGGDSLTRAGAPLQVAQRVERVYSWETSPILTGASAFTSADRYERASGFGGDAASFFWNALLKFDTQTVTSRTRSLLGNYPGSSGFVLNSLATHSSLQATFTNAALGAVSAPTFAIAAADVGKLLSITAGWDAAAGKVRFWVKRAEQGTGITMVGYTPGAGTLRLGEAVGGGPNDGVTIYGFQYGLGIPSLAEVQANYDATMADEDIVAFPGSRSTALYSLKRSIAENGGAMPATLIDRIGTAHLTRTGSPALSPQYARAWAA